MSKITREQMECFLELAVKNCKHRSEAGCGACSTFHRCDAEYRAILAAIDRADALERRWVRLREYIKIDPYGATDILVRMDRLEREGAATAGAATAEGE